jgi:hypothetical protein
MEEYRKIVQIETCRLVNEFKANPGFSPLPALGLTSLCLLNTVKPFGSFKSFGLMGMAVAFGVSGYALQKDKVNGPSIATGTFLLTF